MENILELCEDMAIKNKETLNIMNELIKEKDYQKQELLKKKYDLLKSEINRYLMEIINQSSK